MPFGHSGVLSDRLFDSSMNLFLNITRMHPAETGQITDRLSILKVGCVDFYVFRGGDAVICIDSGFDRAQVLRQLKRLQIDPGEITHLFLTHSDFDHAGGLDLFDRAELFLSADEEQMVDGSRKRMYGIYHNAKIRRECRLLRDGEVIRAGSSAVRAIATPGHTPGSMSYLLDDAILFTGDTLRLVDGKARPVWDRISMDVEQEKESIRRLARLQGVELLCTGHSGVTGEFDAAMRDWQI